MNDETQASAYLRLIDIGIALSADKDLDSLLQHILLEAKSMANADAGTIYLNTGDDSLRFSIVVNDSLGIVQGGKSGNPVELPEIPLYEEDGSPNLSSIASSVVHKGKTIVVGDASTNEEFDFTRAHDFNQLMGYDSQSFLTVPLKTLSNESLGVLQLLNAKNSKGEFGPFSKEIIPLIEALSSQASVAMENRALLDEQEELKMQLEREVDNTNEELKEALTKLSEAHIILKELNTIDAVTGIRNRHYFDEMLGQEWRRAKRQGYDISLLLLDIDHFKKVNDTYGHLAGDECLAAVATAVDQMFNRPSDIVARYGGEEFVVVLPYVSVENACGLAEQLRLMIEESVYHCDGNDIKVTMSIGVATVSPKDDEEVAPRDLIGQADSVLYAAKSTGRNQVCQYKQKVSG